MKNLSEKPLLRFRPSREGRRRADGHVCEGVPTAGGCYEFVVIRFGLLPKRKASDWAFSAFLRTNCRILLHQPIYTPTRNMSIEPPKIFSASADDGPPRKLAVLTSGGDSAGASLCSPALPSAPARAGTLSVCSFSFADNLLDCLDGWDRYERCRPIGRPNGSR